ncbi:MAG: hypothetical protein LC808_27000 [Actinobacteria bacterium]|nr:hypothetical protein [Actinomycetota bacterium]
MSSLDLARGPCPKGEHLTKKTPVVCVPNKERELRGVNIDPGIIDAAWTMIMVTAVVLCIRRLYLWWQRRRAPALPIDPCSEVPVGAQVLSPTLGWGDLGWGSRSHGFYVPREAIGHHMVIAGGTGSGKTNTAEVLEYAAAETYGPQIIHFDCKGSRTGMARFLALMAAAGYDPLRVHLFPIEPYDGWRGGSDARRALLGRLLQIQDWGEPFYAAGTKDLLQSVLFSSEPPASSSEFVARLEALPANGNQKLVDGARARYRGFYNGLSGALDGRWAFEDCDACYIQLEGFGLPSEAVSLGRFLLEDLTHYLADRKPDDRPVLLVLDEFSAISSGADAANLIERAREFGAGVILTTQSYAGLGGGAERVLDAARGGLIIHSLANPEPFTSRAGTVTREVVSVTQPARQPGLISGILFNQEPEMPRTTTRPQDFPRIDPNEVRQLPRGEAFVINGGRAQRVAFNHIDLWDENIELAAKDIHRRQQASLVTSNGHRQERKLQHHVAAHDPDLDF